MRGLSGGLNVNKSSGLTNTRQNLPLACYIGSGRESLMCLPYIERYRASTELLKRDFCMCEVPLLLFILSRTIKSADVAARIYSQSRFGLMNSSHDCIFEALILFGLNVALLFS